MIIYRIFNKINNKSYIGQSINDFNKRYKGNKWWKHTHNIILKNSINKYGLENFEFELLEENVENIDKLNELEIYYAEKYNSYRPTGYNIRGCGDNKFVDDDLKKHLSKHRLGKDYRPKNKKSSEYKGVYWRESKKCWICRFHNSNLKKDKYTSSEIEAAEIYDKIALFIMGNDCFINFEDKREEYLKLDLEKYFNEEFLQRKNNRKEGYYKDDTELLNKIKPLIWKKSVPKISKEIGVSKGKIKWCIKKHKLESPTKNYWQRNEKKN